MQRGKPWIRRDGFSQVRLEFVGFDFRDSIVAYLNILWRVNMTTKTWQETLASIKPQVRVIPKVKVMRKKSWRRDDFTYEVEFVKPTWESLSLRDRVQFVDCFVRSV
jgi:hypothetical protein